MKKITMLIPSTQRAFNFTAHGLTQSKILSISVLATVPGGFEIIPNHWQTGYEYTLNLDNGNVAIGATTGNSANILGSQVVVLIMYKKKSEY